MNGCSYEPGVFCKPFGLIAIMAWAAILGPSPVLACDTPVYRYAMYNWAPSPYHVFYFHRGQEAERDKAVNRTLAEIGRAGPAAANLVFQKVAVSDEKRVEDLDNLVRQTWQSHHGSKTPLHLVLTPWGAELFAGRLDAATVRAMTDSPLRTRLGKLLEEGNAAVLLFLAGPNEEENRQAEKVARQVIADASAGKISIAGPPGTTQFLPVEPADDDTAAENDDDSRKRGPEVVLVKLSRTDPAETWLVRSLMRVEQDLQEYAERPMIFAVYGRGRTMMPYIGKGITPDNLTQCVAFLTGACSCMVKTGTPGADLLVRYDWESAADALAAGDQRAVPGDQLAYYEFIPGEQQDEVSSPESKTPSQIEPSPGKAEPGSTDPATTTPEMNEQSKARELVGQPPAAPEDSFASRQVWLFGIGFAVLAVVLLTAGMIIIRRQ